MVVVVDLSQPQHLWETTDVLLTAVRQRVNKVIDDLNRRESKSVQEQCACLRKEGERGAQANEERGVELKMSLATSPLLLLPLTLLSGCLHISRKRRSASLEMTIRYVCVCVCVCVRVCVCVCVTVSVSVGASEYLSADPRAGGLTALFLL